MSRIALRAAALFAIQARTNRFAPMKWVNIKDLWYYCVRERFESPLI